MINTLISLAATCTITWCLSVVTIYGQQPQSVSVTTYLQQIAKGWPNDAKKALPDLLIERPDDPAVMFLHASLVEDPKKALPLYERIVERYSSSDWADDALLRIIIQACTGREETKAVKSFQQLRSLYPNSDLLPVAYDVMRNSVGLPAAAEATSPPTVQKESKPAVPPDSVKSALTQPTTATHPYTLVVLTSRSKSNAEETVAKLRKKGLKVDYAEKWVKGLRNYVVQVGWYKSEVEAAAEIDAMRKICSCKPVVARRMP